MRGIAAVALDEVGEVEHLGGVDHAEMDREAGVDEPRLALWVDPEVVVFPLRRLRRGEVDEAASEPLLDAFPEGRGPYVVDHELEPRPRPRQPVAAVGAPDV